MFTDIPRVSFSDRVSMVKYAAAQLPISRIDANWSSLQNNNNNAWYIELASGGINNNNKNNQYAVRACHENKLYQISLQSLVEAYYDCRRNKKTKNECVRFEFVRERSLVELQQEIEAGEYKPYPSNAFIVTYPTYREVFAAAFRDRIIHHWIAMRLEPLMEKRFIDDSYNCRKGRGTSYGVNRTVQMMQEATENWTAPAYVVKWDFSGYFMSIQKDKLWQMIVELIESEYKGEDKEVLLYLTKETLYNEPQKNCVRTSPVEMWDKLPKEKSLFTNERNIGLPIGNLTSQLFANFYMWKIDAEMKKRHAGYARYVDDGWIIDRDKRKVLQSVKNLSSMLEEYGVHLHKKKFYCQSAYKGLKVIGVVIKPHRVYVSNRTRCKCRQKIYNYNVIRPSKQKARKLQASMNSYLGLMKQYQAYNLQIELLGMIGRKWRKYVAPSKNKNKLKLLKK